MKKLGLATLLVVLVVLTAGVLAYAQMGSPGGGPGMGGGPGGGNQGQMSDADRAAMRERMVETRLNEAGLTRAEKAAAKVAVKAKEAARDQLSSQLTRLQLAANNPRATNGQMRQALAAYRAALAQYHKTVAAEDATLIRKLSLKSQVKLMAAGILENGLSSGFGGRRGGGGGGGGRRGGGGMGMTR